jgi:hypothetical protein
MGAPKIYTCLVDSLGQLKKPPKIFQKALESFALVIDGFANTNNIQMLLPQL